MQSPLNCKQARKTSSSFFTFGPALCASNYPTPSERYPMLQPRQPVPALQVPTLAHGGFTLAEDAPEHFSLIVFYRGLHCPICLKYLLELGRLQPEFEKRGVKIIAISSDTRERAQAMADKLKAENLRIGYDLPLSKAREWGLYISTSRGTTSIGIEEPALFAEPGVFIVRADATLYYGSVQTMPFARPHFDDLLGALDFALAKNYPARGEYVGAV
ncbi:peroxiredoxin-like family protein [Variovorax sp. LjRoot130]|uniref:peroxiredoxin-like family protein n=1 Tax=Variovorax sp. LjRoot130 TaxID=3342261 RepID=UPI003ED16AFC